MSANPSLYADSFSQSRSPASTFHAVDQRLSLSRALTSDLASYFHERILLEDAYIKSLNKLSQRLKGAGKETVFREIETFGVGDSALEKQLGGGWDGVKKQLEGEVTEQARVHEVWRNKLEKEVEGPLRSSLGKTEWSRWNQAEGQLASSVREYESLVDKVQKAQAKSTKSGKSVSSKQLQSQSALSSLGSSLTSSLPSFLNQSQALDLSHQAFLKECLVRCGTIASDLGRERMEMGERLLVRVLGVDESAEAEEWALREGMKLGGGAAGGPSRNGLAPVGEFGETASVRSGAGGGFGSAAGGSLVDRDDAASTVSGATGIERSRTMSRPGNAPPPAAPLPLPTTDDSRSTKEPKSGLGGKLSSFLGGSKARDRSSSIPNSAKYAAFSTPTDAPPVPRPEMGERRATDASGSSDFLGGGPSGGGMPAPLEPHRTGSGQQDKRKSLMPGGSLFRRPSRAGTQLSDFDERAGSSSAPHFASAMSAEPVESPGTARVDEEGYSMPPEGYDRAIGEPRSGTGRSLLDDDDEPLGESYGTSIPKVSIAPSLPSSPVVAQESEAERRAALESVKNALGAPPAAAAGAGLGRRATARGRRGEGGARNTVYGGAGGLATPPAAERQDSTISEDDVPLATVVQQKHRREAPPPPVNRTAAPTPNDSAATLSPSLPTSPASPGFISPSPAPVAGRAMSVMSGTSSRGPAAAHGRSDPFAGVASPGLRASIIETVNVLLKNGEVTRVLVTGEVGLSYRPSSSSPGGQLKLRLTGLDGLEKTAPNPALLSAAGSGEFTVSPSLAAHNGTTATAFKYQVSLPPTSSAALVPLMVKPTWRCEPGLARAIVTYSTNASSTIFSASSSSSPFGEDDDATTTARLEDVKLDLVLALGTATSFQSKPPSGTLTNSNRALSFSLGSFDAASGGEQKILASIQTEGAAAAQPGPVSISWVLRGRTVGNLGVELVEGGEVMEEVRRETVSGKYLAA
ncbi:fps/Fes/Fer/CIP4-like and SAFF domain-containing protein [Rhodotorula toruloides]|uniref:Fps/Fes/Fer/CIP4-like and SAFF domain-containing protein n=1 Tax=Rhodotorula toruloides TaxID=5286 RepID=A0A511KPF4_RHOTO|nr:fps/Fes/Fer/CIP4-like and SAFF domain-containing protein [Rhodotorula toruloides]